MNTKEMGLILSLNQCIITTDDILESARDSIKRTRSLKSKRSIKNNIEFFEAVAYHLRKLKDLQTK